MVKDYKILIQKYFNKHSFVEANLKSFDNFIEKELQTVIDETGEIIPSVIPSDVQEFKIKVDKIWIEKPQIIEADGSRRDIFPSEARLRKLTYAAPIFLEVSAHIDGVQVESFVSEIGRLPLMIKSKFCHLNGLKREELIEKGEDPDDPGGYFILNGNERVLVMVEDLASNRLFVDKTSVGPSRYNAKIFSEGGGLRIPHLIEQMKDGVIYLSFTRFKRLPIVTVIKALGLTKDQDIANLICGEKEYDDVFVNLFKSVDLKTEDDAVEYLARQGGITQTKEIKMERTREQLDRYLLPHLGVTKEDRIVKAYNLCKIVRRFLMVSRDGKSLSDKDHYINKRIRLSGDLLTELFRVNFRVLINDMLYNFQRLVKRGKFHSIKIIIRDKLLSGRITSALATGNWPGSRSGISQNIDRTNFLGTMSHLKRVVSLLSASQENFEARALHCTHWGRLCLSKDTNVLLADKYSSRNLEMLQNCWHHHKISTFDVKNENLKSSAISKYYTSNPQLIGKKVFKLISESGRKIVATEDHPFYTKHGWLDAIKLNKGDEVAVYPSLDSVKLPELPTEKLGYNIVGEEDIKKNSPSRFKHYIKELRNNELLPLTTNNYKIEIIARLLGHILSDGHCGKYNLEFYCGSKRDAENIAEDIRLLGFKPSKISEKHTKIKTDRGIIKYRTFMLSKGGALRSLLVNAGAPVGKKTDIKLEIPKWIFKSSLSVKREFLGALLGGDGSKPRISIRNERKSGSKLYIDHLIFHKKKNMKKNIIKFSEDIKELFNEFGVLIKRVEMGEDYKRKDGAVMLKCKIIFGKSQNNIKNLLTKIGYRYCIQKEREANYIGEWLRLHDFAIRKRVSLKNKVRSLYKEGVNPKEISSMLNINYGTVRRWLYEAHRYENTRLTQNMLLPYERWLKKVKLGESGTVWEKIVDKKIEDLNDVRDFTTVEDTHSFIANGFITHNCPIETPEGTPIGLRKNLAMLCDVAHKSTDENKIIKHLEKIGLEKNG
ncbi:MAG: DNA-directed RNA polymerase subunit B'' [Nanoarchaeota archaeon]|nr:DNA-directed RNA polymerase subunit B'' [Nanoarchaeota archaeon]